MMKVSRDIDGRGIRDVIMYDLPATPSDPWAAITDVPCPACQRGRLRWAEAGYVPGYRVCIDGCEAHFVRDYETSLTAPRLLLDDRYRDRRKKRCRGCAYHEGPPHGD